MECVSNYSILKFNLCALHFPFCTLEVGGGNGDVLDAANIVQEPENNVAADVGGENIVAGEVNSYDAPANESDVANNENSKYAQYVLHSYTLFEIYVLNQPYFLLYRQCF